MRLSKCFCSVAMALATIIGLVFLGPAYDKNVVRVQSFSGANLAGLAAGRDQKFDIALAYFQKALFYNPQDASLQRDVLLMLLLNDDFNRAALFARRLKNSGNSSGFVCNFLAVADLKNKNYGRVKGCFQFLGPFKLDQLAYQFVKAWAFYGRGLKTAALNSVKKISDVPPAYRFFVDYQIALLSEATGHKKDAEAYYLKVLNDQTNSSARADGYERAAVAYAAFLYKQNRQQEALAMLQKNKLGLAKSDVLQDLCQKIAQGVKVDSVIKTPQDGAAEFFYSLGGFIGHRSPSFLSQAYLQLALALRPGDDAILYRLAEVAAQAGQHAKALGYYSKISARSAFFKKAGLRMSLVLVAMKQNQQAIQHLVQLEKSFPTEQRIQIILSELYLQNKDVLAAEQAVERALSHIKTPQQTDWSLYYQSAVVKAQLQQWEGAQSDVFTAHQTAGDDAMALSYLGSFLVAHSMRLDEAAKMLEKALKMRPNDWHLIASLGWAYYKLKRYDDAAFYLEKSVLMAPHDVSVNDQLGDVYWRVGRKREAVFQWNHAIAYGAESQVLAKLKSKLQNGLEAEATAP